VPWQLVGSDRVGKTVLRMLPKMKSPILLLDTVGYPKSHILIITAKLNGKKEMKKDPLK
jgi:hypothetical protein